MRASGSDTTRKITGHDKSPLDQRKLHITVMPLAVATVRLNGSALPTGKCRGVIIVAPTAIAMRVNVKAHARVNTEPKMCTPPVARVDGAKRGDELRARDAPIFRHEIERVVSAMRAPRGGVQARVKRLFTITGHDAHRANRRLDMIANDPQRRRNVGPCLFRRRDVRRRHAARLQSINEPQLPARHDTKYAFALQARFKPGERRRPSRISRQPSLKNLFFRRRRTTGCKDDRAKRRYPSPRLPHNSAANASAKACASPGQRAEM